MNRDEMTIEQFGPYQYPVRWLIVTLAIIICITFFPYLFGGKTFLPSDMVDTMTSPFNAEFGPPQSQNHYPFDALAQGYPYKVLTKEAFERGKLAYWTSHILGGYPEYAESLANNFDVFNIILLWLSPLDAFHWETGLELLVAGIGMILLLRFFRTTPFVNLTFSTAFMLNSMFIALAHHRCPIASFCWMPFIVLMILRYIQSHRNENIIYASLFLALAFLGGNFQTSFFIIFILLLIIFTYPSALTIRYRLVSFSVVCGLGFLISALMWLPCLELFYQGVFGGGHIFSTTVHGSYTLLKRTLSFPLLLHFFLPGLAGSPQIYSVRSIAGVDGISFNGAIGFLPALFAFWGCFSLWKKRAIRPFIIIAASGILLPILTPMYNYLYHRFFIVSTFSFCIIGAVFFQSFLNQSSKREFDRVFKWVQVSFASLVIALVIVCLIILLKYDSIQTYLMKNMDSAFGRSNEFWLLTRVERTLDYYSFSSLELWLPVIIAGIAIAMLRLYRAGKLLKKNILPVFFIFTTFQLFVFTRMWLSSVDPMQFPIFPKNPIIAYLQSDSSGARYYAWRDFWKDPYMMMQNSSNVYKINDIQGYETCTNQSIHVLHKLYIHPDSLDKRLLGLANVKYIIVGKRNITDTNLRYLYSADSLTIYENLLCKPRAYFAYKTIIEPNDSAAAKQLLRSDFDGSQALFTKKDALADNISTANGKDSIHFDKSANEEVAITAQTDTKGIFILTDTYYPGWKCYVNGKETEIHRVNYCMRGIVLNAGKSNIIFKFEPDVFKVGASISTIAVFLCLAGIPILKRRRKTANMDNEVT